MDFVKFFSDCEFNIDLLGGKGSNLVKLKKNKFNVPDGFIITSQAYLEFISRSRYRDKLNPLLCTELNPKEILTCSDKIQDYILKSALPEQVKKEIKEAYKLFLEKFTEEVWFSVRSSANIEDGDKFSFAGQADTFLFRKSLSEIYESVKACWTSLFSPRALLYYTQMEKLGQNIVLNQLSMAVIVQKMIDSDISGVLFTANVLNNNPKEMLINSTWGLGEALVSGIVTPDTILFDRGTKKVVKKVIGKKEKKTIPDYENSKTKVIKTDPQLQRKCCLTKEQIFNLHNKGVKIERLYDSFPQDIEWALKNNELFILQTRPITTYNKDLIKQ